MSSVEIPVYDEATGLEFEVTVNLTHMTPYIPAKISGLPENQFFR